MLVKPKSTIKVECLPNDIPVDIEVDVSALTIGENVRTEDLSFSGSQKVVSNPKDILVKIESTKISKTAESEASTEEAGQDQAESDEQQN